MTPSTRGERLQWARRSAGFKSPRAAAQHFRWNENTYKAREQGFRDYGVEEAYEYAKAYNTSWVWLISGQNLPEASGSKVPLVGQIVQDGIIKVLPDSDHLREISLELPVPSHFRAYEVRGYAMYPKFEPNDIILVGNPLFDVTNEVGKICIIVNSDEQWMIGRIQFGSDAGKWNLERFNAPTVSNIEIFEVLPIALIMPASSVERSTPHG